MNRGRPPYWTVFAFAALMITPAPWFTVALAGIVVVPWAVQAARTLAARRRVAPAVEAGINVGRDERGRPVVLTERQLAAHALILGASGAGKSTTMLAILGRRIEQGLPVVAVDLKGSPAFARALAGAAARAGRPFRIWTPDGPSHWNPLAHGNPTQLKDKLIATERFTEPHYQRAAERYLQTVLTVLGAIHPGRPPTLDEVVNLSEPRRLAAAVRPVQESLRGRVQDYLEGMSPDQLSAVRGLATRLAIVTESHTGRYLTGRENEIDLPAALRGDAIVLFSLNSSSYGKLAAQIGTMVVQDLVSAAGARLGEAGESAPPALVAIDEFSALGADQLVNLFARGRESGIGVIVATQELADLHRAAPGLREQVLGNTTVKIIHRQDVAASARMVAEMTGTQWVWQETRYFGAMSLREAIGGRGSRRQVEQPLVHPNRIMSLRTGEAVLITKVPETEVRVLGVEARERSAVPGGRSTAAGGRVVGVEARATTAAAGGRAPMAARTPRESARSRAADADADAGTSGPSSPRARAATRDISRPPPRGTGTSEPHARRDAEERGLEL